MKLNSMLKDLKIEYCKYLKYPQMVCSSIAIFIKIPDDLFLIDKHILESIWLCKDQE